MSGNAFYPYAPYQQYQAAAGATPYPQLFTGQESYAGVAAQHQAYHQAWYNYAYQHHAHAAAAAAAAARQQIANVPTAPPLQTVISTAPSATASAAGSTSASATTNTSAVTSAPTTTTTVARPQTSTFSAYTPPTHHQHQHQTPSSASLRAEAASSAYVNSFSSRASRKSQMRGIFSKELPKLMYGFGDDKQVANDTVGVMEEILIEYIVDICQTALQQSTNKKARLQIEDLRRALARDPKKLARMEELLFMQEDIKRARKQFEDEGGGY